MQLINKEILQKLRLICIYKPIFMKYRNGFTYIHFGAVYYILFEPSLTKFTTTCRIPYKLP